MGQSWLARSVHRSPRIVVAVVAAWTELAEAIRAGIVTMVEAASGSRPDLGAKLSGARKVRFDRPEPQ